MRLYCDLSGLPFSDKSENGGGAESDFEDSLALLFVDAQGA
jgi:hypothetical protein